MQINRLPALSVKLPDLNSRLTWGEIYQLNSLTDEQKSKYYSIQLTNEGFQLSDETANFLITRLARDMHTLFEALDLLDKSIIASTTKSHNSLSSKKF